MPEKTKKKTKTLAEALPDPVEQLRLEVSSLDGKVAELTAIIDAAVEIINDLENNEAAANMAGAQQVQALQDIAASLEGIHQIKKTYADKMNGREAARKEQAQNGGDTPKPAPTVDLIIKRILEFKPNLTEVAVRQLIDKERAKSAGLLTEEAAAYLVASNLGISGDTPSPFNLNIPLDPASTIVSTIPNIDMLEAVITPEGVTLTPKKFMGDLWGATNDEVRKRGGGWIRDGRESHWLIEGAPQAAAQGVKV